MRKVALLSVLMIVVVVGCAKNPCRPVILSNDVPDLVKVRKMENGTASVVEMPKAMLMNEQGLEVFQYEILNRCAQSDGLNVVFKIDRENCTVVIK